MWEFGKGREKRSGVSDLSDLSDRLDEEKKCEEGEERSEILNGLLRFSEYSHFAFWACVLYGSNGVDCNCH